MSSPVFLKEMGQQERKGSIAWQTAQVSSPKFALVLDCHYSDTDRYI